MEWPIKIEEIRTRKKVEWYATCPVCGHEISDIDVGEGATTKCPHCENEIVVEN